MKIGFLKKERIVAKPSWRIVDAQGVDIVQPWSNTKADARKTATQLDIELYNTIDDAIQQGMAQAFFASAWSEQCEETGNGSTLSGKEILEIMPRKRDTAAHHAAKTLYMDMCRANEAAKNSLFGAATGGPEPYGLIALLYLKHTGGLDPLTWGHYAAMQAMGHGVGLWEYDITDDAVKVPYVEFGSHSLEKDYF